MTNEAMRDQFERWATSRALEEMQLAGSMSGAGWIYHDRSVHELWIGFQAGRDTSLLHVPPTSTKRGFMCLVDFRHELGEASGGVTVYPDIDDLRANRKCVHQCGIAEVEVRLVSVPQQGDYSTAKHIDPDRTSLPPGAMDAKDYITEVRKDPEMSAAMDRAQALASEQPAEVRFIRQSQLLPHIVPVSAATLWRWVAAGKFPKPVRLSEKVTAWRSDEVDAWIKEKK